MDVALAWTAVGTVGTCAALGIASWQLRLQALERSRAERPAGQPEVFGLPVAVPTGALPVRVHGRDALLRDLRRWARRPPGEAIVLTGMGGVGKSTVAATLAERWRAGRRHRRVWWISAADRATLAAGLVTVVRHLKGAQSDLTAIAAGAADGPDRFWALLGRARTSWMLIFDNADDPDVLSAVSHPGSGDAAAPPSARGPGDGTGWIRRSRRGLIVVTSRNADPRTWGGHAQVREVTPLGDADAVNVLKDLAGAAGDEAEARMLARRLGGLPLALHLVGAYLGAGTVRFRTFAAYHHALDHGYGAQLLDGLDHKSDPRSIVTQTWEISLDHLTDSGTPHARGLLRLLSCYAPASPIPLGLLDGRLLTPLLEAAPAFGSTRADLLVEQAVRELDRLGLVETRPLDQTTAMVVHPVVADTNRHHLANAPAASTDPPQVERIAVDLVIAYLTKARPDRPGDWPRYRMLTPHLHTLLDRRTPHVDQAQLAALIQTTRQTVRALHLSGALEDSEALGHAARHHAGELGEEHPVTVRVDAELAWVVTSRGRWPEAEDRYRRALERSRRVLGDEHPDTLAVGHRWAWTVAISGRYAAAEDIFRDVLRARRRVLGDDHPDTLDSYHELAWVAAARGRWAEAEAAYRRLLPVRRRVLGEDHPGTLLTHHELGWAIASQGRLDEARAVFEQVLQDRRRVLGDEHPRTLTTLQERAMVAAGQGRLTEAMERYRHVWQRRRQLLGDDHPDTLTARHELAWVTALLGQQATAETIYSEVAAARRRVLGHDHPATLLTQAALDGLKEGRIIVPHHLA